LLTAQAQAQVQAHTRHITTLFPHFDTAISHLIHGSELMPRRRNVLVKRSDHAGHKVFDEFFFLLHEEPKEKLVLFFRKKFFPPS